MQDSVRRDESFIAELCKYILESGIKHSEGDIPAVFRLGKSTDDGTSIPLLIKMKNSEKADIMANAKKLARAEDCFRISVRHDQTGRQRETIKTAVERAKQSAVGNEMENWTYKAAGPMCTSKC